MILQSIHLNPRNHATVSGMAVLLTLGTFALVALCIAAFWLLLQFVLLAFQSMVECGNAIESTFQSADPMIRFLMLLAIGFVLYRIVRRFNWRI
jgi:glycopeptide antibiotics resistance protein